MKSLLLGLGLWCCCTIVMAQDSSEVNYKTKSGKKMENAPSSTARELSSSLEKKDDRRSAALYEELAEQFAKKGDYAKSEQYYKQALDLYREQKNKKKVSELNRSIAKIQEQQNKTKDAIRSYEGAANSSVSKKEGLINTNDAQRLRSSNNPQAQRVNLSSNIQVLEEESKSEEVADVYQQWAEVELQDKNHEAALSKYEKAIKSTKDADKKAEIKKQIAEVYASKSNYGEALKMSEQIYHDAQSNNDVPLQIQQLQRQSNYQTAMGNDEQSLVLLRKAYDLAVQTNNTNAAKSVTEAIASFYNEKNDYKNADAAYRNFLNDLDSLIINDSSITENKLLEITEGRIRELETERALQLQIIRNKSNFNYFLIGSVIVMVLLLGFIAKSLFAIKKKNKKIALQSLRREMNPHFIFNSLNSVNQFIAENDELQANKYLTSYSALMRNVMEHSNKDFVTLSSEMEQLQKYLELEHLRFKDKFDFTVSVDDNIDTDAILIPNMLIQPQLENAIWHGLRYKGSKGNLILEFSKVNNHINVIIADDGIGIEKSKAMKTFHQKAHKSRGMSNTTERINLLNELYRSDISIEIKDRTGKQSGTVVILKFPIIDKKYAHQ